MKKPAVHLFILVRLLTGPLRWTGPTEALVRSFTGRTAGLVQITRAGSERGSGGAIERAVKDKQLGGASG